MSSLETVDLGGGGVFSVKRYPKIQATLKFHYFHINKQIMNDLKQPMPSYYMVYFEKFRKGMQRTQREALNYLVVFTVSC